jgi:hypothetical protein
MILPTRVYGLAVESSTLSCFSFTIKAKSIPPMTVHREETEEQGLEDG